MSGPMKSIVSYFMSWLTLNVHKHQCKIDFKGMYAMFDWSRSNLEQRLTSAVRNVKSHNRAAGKMYMYEEGGYPGVDLI